MPQLKPELKEKILASNEIIGRIADKVRQSFLNVKRNVDKDSKMLALSVYENAIREEMGLPADAEIFEPVTVHPIAD